MSSQRQYLRADDVAALLGLSTRTVRRWLAGGTLPSVKIGGARLVLEDDLLMHLGRNCDFPKNAGADPEESCNQIKQLSSLGKAQSK